MKDMIKMVLVLTLLSCVSGGLLAFVRIGTKERIEKQELEFVKGPAIRDILTGASNNPLEDRFKLMDGEVERSFFVGVFEGKPNRIAFESAGKGGYGGDVGLMVGVDIEKSSLIGVGVTTHSETPGMGAKAQSDPSFVAQFKGLGVDKPVAVSKDGGSINAISGATITSRAVCSGTSDALSIYTRLKPQLLEKSKAFEK
ncbi:MAG: RnfABCDGE type electron transport complex subunit G [Desulfobacteraceae bacterium]|nr:RnfABCDGE type electron transport complex subunit G [Desulfobacteraceae bacterium]